MLVLSRKPGEQLQIGDNVTITVLEVRGRKLTLGIQAPRGGAHSARRVRLLPRSLRRGSPGSRPSAMQLSA